jgi:hypothetical protein
VLYEESETYAMPREAELQGLQEEANRLFLSLTEAKMHTDSMQRQVHAQLPGMGSYDRACMLLETKRIYKLSCEANERMYLILNRLSEAV